MLFTTTTIIECHAHYRHHHNINHQYYHQHRSFFIIIFAWSLLPPFSAIRIRHRRAAITTVSPPSRPPANISHFTILFSAEPPCLFVIPRARHHERRHDFFDFTPRLRYQADGYVTPIYAPPLMATLSLPPTFSRLLWLRSAERHFHFHDYAYRSIVTKI